LESTLIRAEALFRRFQRTVEAIDKKSSFPAPKLRQRPVRNSSSANAASQDATASTSGVDAVTAGSTNSGRPVSSDATRPVSADGKDKGKRVSGELEDIRPKVISSELRGLLSRKVEVLPRKVVRKTGEGISSLSGSVKDAKK
jgi:hypothetical protein